MAMLNDRIPCRRRRRRRAASLLLLALCASSVAPVAAGVFGRRAKVEKDATIGGEKDVSVPDAPAKEGTIDDDVPRTESAAAEPEPADVATDPAEETELASGTGTTDDPPSAAASAPSRPPTIVEAEARTARELGRAVRTLTRDLETCVARADAVEAGFQNLYASHLAHVDMLRKCREGVGPSDEEWERLDATTPGLDGVGNEALVERARAREDTRKRNERDDALASKHRALVHSLEERIESLVTRERSWERTISELQARRDLLERREGAWERTIGDLMGEIEVRARREEWWEEMKTEMEGRIGALSRKAVVERFGPGPHHVSMTVLLDEGNPSSQRTLVFQLASLDQTPHSVHLFLAQIAEGHWSRGAPAFVLAAGHVLQACPHPCLDHVDLGGRQTGYPYEDLRTAGLDVVSFQEYSPSHPHERYTIGFAGRPNSGPEFYVNLRDNTLDHGTLEERRQRMGPAEYEAWAENAFGGVEEADADGVLTAPYPCFGRLVEGFDVVDEIARGLTRASLPRDDSEDEDEEGPEPDENLLLRPVRIASVTILENYVPKSEGKDDAKINEGGANTMMTDEL